MFEALFSGLNFLAVLAAAAASMVIGFLWYGPLFAKPWSALTGWTEEKIKQLPASKMGMSYGLTFLSAVVMFVVLAFVVKFTGAVSATDGLQAGGLMWLGFVAMPFASGFLFEHRPGKLYLIETGYQLANLLAGGVILTLWK